MNASENSWKTMQNAIKSGRGFGSLVRFMAKPLAGWWAMAALASVGGAATTNELPGNLVGMYIHQHWPYNYPYAARTWQVEDYRGYCGALKTLGYNTVMIWPLLETMPSPLTASDRANLKKIAAVIDMLHRELGMRVYIALCPNVGAKDGEARKAPFEKRHFFYCDTRVNPADPQALAPTDRAAQGALPPAREGGRRGDH